MATLAQFLDQQSQQYDFDKPIGVVTHALAVAGMHDFFRNERLKHELKKCSNVRQMQNTIAQLTDELNKERSNSEIEKFAGNFHKLCKMARL